jgi:hypothetical protein
MQTEVAFVLLRAVAVSTGGFENGLHLGVEVHFVSGRSREGQSGKNERGARREHGGKKKGVGL